MITMIMTVNSGGSCGYSSTPVLQPVLAITPGVENQRERSWLICLREPRSAVHTNTTPTGCPKKGTNPVLSTDMVHDRSVLFFSIMIDHWLEIILCGWSWIITDQPVAPTTRAEEETREAESPNDRHDRQFIFLLASWVLPFFSRLIRIITDRQPVGQVVAELALLSRTRAVRMGQKIHKYLPINPLHLGTSLLSLWPIFYFYFYFLIFLDLLSFILWSPQSAQ